LDLSDKVSGFMPMILATPTDSSRFKRSASRAKDRSGPPSLPPSYANSCAGFSTSRLVSASTEASRAAMVFAFLSAFFATSFSVASSSRTSPESRSCRARDAASTLAAFMRSVSDSASRRRRATFLGCFLLGAGRPRQRRLRLPGERVDRLTIDGCAVVSQLELLAPRAFLAELGGLPRPSRPSPRRAQLLTPCFPPTSLGRWPRRRPPCDACAPRPS
jgi:hypothetical protein